MLEFVDVLEEINAALEEESKGAKKQGRQASGKLRYNVAKFCAVLTTGGWPAPVAKEAFSCTKDDIKKHRCRAGRCIHVLALGAEFRLGLRG